jgi:hypothetical protein
MTVIYINTAHTLKVQTICTSNWVLIEKSQLGQQQPSNISRRRRIIGK